MSGNAENYDLIMKKLDELKVAPNPNVKEGDSKITLEISEYQKNINEYLKKPMDEKLLNELIALYDKEVMKLFR